MKYLLTEGLSAEDFSRFIEAHDASDTFIDEYQLRDFAGAFAEYTAHQAVESELGVNEGILNDGIVQGLIADMDVIVCYSDDAKGYRRFGKKIITMESSDEPSCQAPRRNKNVHHN